VACYTGSLIEGARDFASMIEIGGTRIYKDLEAVLKWMPGNHYTDQVKIPSRYFWMSKTHKSHPETKCFITHAILA
jgi:hypothetical protein